MIILDGFNLAQLIKKQIKQQVKEIKKNHQINPKLSAILVGDNPASQIYLKNKKKNCEEVGIDFTLHSISDNENPDKLYDKIEELNKSKDIHAILVQLPIPNSFSTQKVFKIIDPTKDVDGFSYLNAGYLFSGSPNILPCTPKGIIRLIEHYNIPIEGKNAVIIGRSNIVGKPLAQLLLSKNATICICHSKTQNLISYTKKADIVVSAVGKANFLTKEHFKKNAILIDVGMNRLENGKICGDVMPNQELEKILYAATPVPKGVGPMTIAMLLENTLQLTINIQVMA